MRLLRAALPVVVAWGLSGGLALGGQWAEFADGRALRVAGAVVSEETATLILEEGGRIVVPAGRVVNRATLKPPAPPREPVAAPAAEGPVVPAWRTAAGAYADVIDRAAERHDLDPALLTAVAETESAFDPEAVSPKGAQGLLQLMPDTARRFGVRDAFDPRQNVEGGARYLRWLLERFDGDAELALAGYNAGEGAVDRHNGVPPYRETRNYVSRVLEVAGRLAAPAARTAGSRSGALGLAAVAAAAPGK